MKVLSWINFVLGLWLIAAAFTLSLGGGAVMVEEIVLGAIIAMFACYAAVVEQQSSAISWIVAFAGLWTLFAPAVIAYGAFHASKANDIVVGIVAVVLGFANAVYLESPVRMHG